MRLVGRLKKCFVRKCRKHKHLIYLKTKNEYDPVVLAICKNCYASHNWKGEQGRKWLNAWKRISPMEADEAFVETVIDQ